MAQELLKLEVHVILLYTGELYRQKLLSEVRDKEKMNESKNYFYYASIESWYKVYGSPEKYVPPFFFEKGFSHFNFQR